MRKDHINVVPNKPKECWSIYKGLNKTPSKSCKTKLQAEQWARKACQKWDMSLALYNLDGKLSARNSFVKTAAKKKPVRKPIPKSAKKTMTRRRAPR